MAAVAANPRAWLNIAEIEEGDDDRAAVRPRLPNGCGGVFVGPDARRSD
jgi:hypothetical protein